MENIVSLFIILLTFVAFLIFTDIFKLFLFSLFNSSLLLFFSDSFTRV